MAIDLKKEVRYIKGVGEVRANQLKRIGISTVGDLMMYFPHRYEDRRNVGKIAMINDGDTSLVKGCVIESRKVMLRKGKTLVKIKVEDGSGVLTLIGFNQPYLKEVLKIGSIVFIYGKFTRERDALETSNFTYEVVKPEGESSVHVGRIVPIYSLTHGISQKGLRKIIYNTVKKLENDFLEYFPVEFLKEEKICDINQAIKNIHFPDEIDDANIAGKRIILGEFFIFQTALALRKINTKKVIKKQRYEIKRNLLTPFKEKLKFDFTADQKKAINEIFNDLVSIHPMKRLLQGEVGSGKTVVALSAILLAVENSYPGVVIAPTEILAEQHYLTFKSYLKDLGVNILFLIGNMKKSSRRKVLKDINSGKADIVVGTHALLEDDVNLSGAGIIVIDEQHRFGVRQREILMSKSSSMDVLSMSATPIPRTLAMCSYGDLDVSTIKELPQNRKRPITKYTKENNAYGAALKELKSGNLVYIVHPLIEESDNTEWKSAEKRFKELRHTVFKDYQCGLLHGRMDSKDKEEVMRKFSEGKYQVLFTTTVIEVGIDVPKATIMIIENFNKYGLATIHQLRGRIARSHLQPYCFLTGKITTPESRKRLKVVLSTTDGFRIAEEDLKLRGAGELFGTKQHGIMDFKLGDPVRDFELLKIAREYAFKVIKSDNKLRKKEYQHLRNVVLEKYGYKFHLADVG